MRPVRLENQVLKRFDDVSHSHTGCLWPMIMFSGIIFLFGWAVGRIVENILNKSI